MLAIHVTVAEKQNVPPEQIRGIFGGDVDSEETMCVDKGDPTCRFVV
jgi:hypothetical protein